MPMNWETIQLALTDGVDTQYDRKTIPVGKLAELENGRFDKRGAINKRLGSTELDTTLTEAQAISRRGRALCLVSNGTLYSRDDIDDEWLEIGGAAQLKITRDTIEGIATGIGTDGGYTLGRVLACADMAIAGDIEFFVYPEWSPDIKWVARSKSTGAMVASGALARSVTNYASARCIAVGTTKIHVVYFSGVGEVSLAVFDVASQSMGTPSAISTDYKFAGGICVTTDGTYSYVAHSTNSAGGYAVEKFDSSGSSVAGPTARATYQDGVALDVAPDGTVIVVAADKGGNVVAQRFNSSLVYQASTTLGSITSEQPSVACKFKSTISGGYYDLYVLWGEGADPFGVKSALINTNDSTSTFDLLAGDNSHHVQIGSNWFEGPDGDMYIWLVHAGLDSDGKSVYPGFFLVREDGVFAATALLGESSDRSPDKEARSFYNLPNIVNDSDVYYAAFLSRTGIGTYIDSSRAVERIGVDFGDQTVRRFERTKDIVYLMGAIISQFDGQNVVEHGFLQFPVDISLSAGTSGSLTQLASYSYKVYYQRRLANGDLEISGSIGAVNITLTGSQDDVDVIVPSVYLSNDTSKVEIAVYRTEANPTADSPFYLVGTEPNDTTAATVTLSDTISDATLITHQLDPFGGGQLDTVTVGPTHISTTGKSRMFLSDGARVFYSKLRASRAPFQFNDSLTMDMPSPGGEITGLAILNDLLVIFKENAIYIVAGEGPNNLGIGSFAAPQLVSLDVGCSDQRSIVNTPVGVMFKHGKGIYVLTQGLQTQYVGAPVEDFNDQDVTAATLMEGKNEVRFLTSSGNSLIYDYYRQQWSTDTGRTGIGATQIDGTYYWAESDGTVNYETGFTDAGAGYSLKIVTPWIRLKSLQGFWRARRLIALGEYKSAGTIRVRIAYDYDESWVDSHSFTLVDEDPMQFRLRFSRQKVQAIKLEIMDTSPNGESFSLSELALEVGLKDGLFRLGASRTADKA